jgi:DNA-binding protein H-NS
MPTYKELQTQIEDLQRQAAAARKEELATTIRDIRRKIAEFGLTAADIGLAPPTAGSAPGRGRKPGSKGPGRPAARAEGDQAQAPAKAGRRKARKSADGPVKKVAPKYRGPQGEEWTGRGRKPKWVEAELAAGRSLNDLLIPSAA